jgi:hypothetical protein
MDDPVVWILVIVVLAAAAGGYLYLRNRAPKVEEVFHFNCPQCRRRFGYRAKQAGNAGQCPHCGRRFNFPHVPGNPPAKGH